MKLNKNTILFSLIIILILLLVGSHFRSQGIVKSMQKDIDAANEHVVELDNVKKEADGQYAKLIDTYETEKSLKESLKESNKDLYKTLKKKNERILMLNNTVISMRSEASSGEVIVDNTDTNSIQLSLEYPKNDSDQAFIFWDGRISLLDRKYKGEWNFGKLPFQIVMTETERGLWNSRIVGPDWLTVDSIDIKSLPKEELVETKKERKFGFIAGGGYLSSMDANGSNGIFIGGGLYYNNEMLLLNASTTNTVGLGYYHRFGSVKK